MTRTQSERAPVSLPAGFRLQHDPGSGWALAARDLQLRDLVTIEHVSLAVPSVAGAGDRLEGRSLQNSQLALTSLDATINEAGLNRWLDSVLRAEHTVRDVHRIDVRFDAGYATLLIHGSGQPEPSSTEQPALVTCRAWLEEGHAPGASSDLLRVRLLNHVGYGPPGAPPPQRIAYAAVCALAGTASLLPADVPGTGGYGIERADDVLFVRPVKLILAELLSVAGFKLPRLRASCVTRFAIVDGAIRIMCRDLELNAQNEDTTFVMRSDVGRRLLQERRARATFQAVDNALIDNRIEDARTQLEHLCHRLGPSAPLVERLGYALLAEPDSTRGRRVEQLCDDVLRRAPGRVTTRVLKALALRTTEPAAPEQTAHVLRGALGYLDEGTHPVERVALLLATAELEVEFDPTRAATALHEANRLAPNLPMPLERLARLYADRGERAAEIELLRRLLTLEMASKRRAHLLLRLSRAEHAHRPVTDDARIALTHAIDACPDDDVSLLRAVAETGRAIGAEHDALIALERATRATDDHSLRARLNIENARLWLAMDGPEEARLAALDAFDDVCAATGEAPVEAAVDVLLEASNLAPSASDRIAPLRSVVERLERMMRSSASREVDSRFQAAFVRACEALARVAATIGEKESARAAWRRLLIRVPSHDAAFEWLREHLRNAPPEARIDIYEARLATGVQDPGSAVELAELYESVGLPGDALRWLDTAIAAGADDPELLDHRIDLLQRTGRHLELRDALDDALDRVIEPRARADLLARIGELELDALRSPRRAVSALRQATTLCPKDRNLLLELRRALRQADDLEALVSVLERLVQLSDDNATKRTFLVEAGDVLYEHLNAPRRAWRFYRDAQALRSDPTLARRLQTILGHDSDISRELRESSEADRGHPQAGPPTDVEAALSDNDVLTPVDTSGNAQESGRPSDDTHPARPAAESLPDPVSEELEIALLAKPDGIGLQLLGAEAELDDLAGATPTPSSLVASPDEDDLSGGDTLPSGELPASHQFRSAVPDSPDSGDDVVSSALGGDATARRSTQRASGRTINASQGPHSSSGGAMEGQFVPPAPDAAPDWREAAETWAARAAAAAPIEPREDTPAAPDATDAEIDAARRDGDPRRLAALLERALEERDLPHERRARLHQELGCLLYFELDVLEAAGEHLEEAVRLDPERVGREAETLTALEGIYEDTDRPEALADIYRAKITHTAEGDMIGVYRVLLAQLLHERLDAPDEARRHVVKVLDAAPEHEGALRTLIDIERDTGHLEEAAAALERIIATLDERPTARARALCNLAELREQAGDVDGGRRALLRAIRDAKSPGAVVDRLKRLCRAHDDWHGLLNTLVREFALDFGAAIAEATGDDDRPGLDRLLELDPGSIPDDRSIEACQTLREMGDILSLKLGETERAWRLYGVVADISPDDAYAVERRIELGRELENWAALAEDLERLSTMLLDPAAQFDALADAAELYRDELDDRLRARELFERAAELYAERDGQHPDRVEDVHEALEQLERTVVVRVSLGTGMHKVPDADAGTEPRPQQGAERAGEPGDGDDAGGDDDASTVGADDKTSTNDTDDDVSGVGLEDGTASTEPGPPNDNEVVDEIEIDVDLEPLEASNDQDDSSAVIGALELNAEEVDALEALERELQTQPSRTRRVELLARKGMLLSRQPETQHEALVSLRAALALDLDHAPARVALVDGLIAMGEIEQALNHLVVLVRRAEERRLPPGLVDEVRALVDVIVEAGIERVVPRARTLRKSLENLD